MSSIRRHGIGTLLVALAVTLPPGPEARAAGQSSADVEAGRTLYEERCTHCHGAEGRGDGPAAPYLDPAPRDFTTGLFKIRSTPFGELPTDEDLFRTLTAGIPGTAMPAWDNYSEQQRRQLVAHVKTLSERFAAEPPPAPAEIGPALPRSAETIERGRELFTELKCTQCHGRAGRGDGLITERLRYEWGFPFPARDLTKPWLFRGGSTTQDIHRTLTTGLNGTPMGSYADYASDEERWALAHYVESLAEGVELESEVVLRARRIEGELPEDPDDEAWSEATPYEMLLTGQLAARPSLWTPSIKSVRARALYNETELAFLLEWNDRTDRQERVFRDAAALQFPVGILPPPEKPYFILGQRRRPVSLWRWTSVVPPERSPDGFVEEPVDAEAALRQGLAELTAEGADRLSAQPPEGQGLAGGGTWAEGRWRVVLRRSLVTDDADEDVQFESGRLIPLAVQVWDGANGDADSRRALSAWHYLLLEEPAPSNLLAYVLIAVLLGINIELWAVPRLRKLHAFYAANREPSPPEGA